MERIYENLVKKGLKRPDEVPMMNAAVIEGTLPQEQADKATIADYEEALHKLGVDV